MRTTAGLVGLMALCSSQARSEWTLEQAEKQWTPMVHPVQHVGVPGYQFQAGVLWDGSLVFGPLAFRELKVMQRETAPLGPNPLHLSVGFGDPMRFVDRKGTRSPSVSRRLEEGYLPIPHVTTRDGCLEWDETVFAHLLDRDFAAGLEPRPGDTLVVHAAFGVRNTGDEDVTGHLWLHFADTSQVQFGYKAGMGREAGPPLAHVFEAPLGLLEGQVRYAIPRPKRGQVVWHDAVPPPDGMAQPLGRVIEWRVALSPGREAELDLILPYGLVDRETGVRLAALDSAKELREVRRAWERLLSGPGAIETPDPFVNDYVRAVAGQMAQQVACRTSSDVWMYKTSPNHYEGYWPCNAAKALPTFDFRGLGDINRRVLGSFVDQQTADTGRLSRAGMGGGPELTGEGYEQRPGFLGNFGEWTANTLLLSHGLELWALAAHYRVTRDRQWLGEGAGSPLQAILDACDWLAVQRRRTMREVDGHKVPHWGLLPAASAHDWLSGNTIFNDAFCIYGMAEAVRMLREISHPRAEDLAAELNAYRGDLKARYVEARDRAEKVPMPDGSMLPYVPRDVGELDWRSIDWTYTGYGPLRAGAWGALDPNDELVDQSLQFLEAGMPVGQGPYFSAPFANKDTADWNWLEVSQPGGGRHWLWRHYVEYETMWPIGWHLFLARDDLPRFFEWLFNNLAAVIHHDFRVGVESLDGVPSCAPGDSERWQAIRSMFVHEAGGYDGSEQALWLFRAIPASWLKPGDRLAVRDMGTYFGGRADLEMAVAADGNSVTATADLDLAVPPSGVRIRLRSGDGRALASATVNGEAAPVLPGDVVELPRDTRAQYRLVGRFGG